jgi:hypothetical protein
MTFWDWVVFVACWSLIPAVHIAKAVLDRRGKP